MGQMLGQREYSLQFKKENGITVNRYDDRKCAHIFFKRDGGARKSTKKIQQPLLPPT